LHPVQWLCDADFPASALVETIVIGRAIRCLIDGYPIALSEPCEQVAVAAAATAKGFEFGLARFATKGAAR
jgi:hypothetical protein